DRLAAEAGVQIGVALEAVWALLLMRLGGSSAFTLGHGCEGRSYPELESALGILAKTLPVPVRADGSVSFRLLLREFDAALREAIGWEEYYNSEAWSSPLPFRFQYEEGTGGELPGGFSIAAVAAFPEA